MRIAHCNLSSGIQAASDNTEIDTVCVAVNSSSLAVKVIVVLPTRIGVTVTCAPDTSAVAIVESLECAVYLRISLLSSMK